MPTHLIQYKLRFLNESSAVRQDVLKLYALLRQLTKHVLSISEDTDIPLTIDRIKNDIVFRGHSAWILIASILIASIGLNVNSTAVVIGAMLISPLMGPILGVGLSVGIQDFRTLTKSLKNLLIAVVLSVGTSAFYFAITPLDFPNDELIARTTPTLLDVLIAVFGGFAGIIAGTSKEKTNAIPGVAIATALMPPLCTAGYGLATLNMSFFLGAIYLFFINSVFISLSTFLVVRYLKFPLVAIVDPIKLKRYQRYLTLFVIVTVIPSIYMFWIVIQKARFEVAAQEFVEEVAETKGQRLISSKITYSDTLSTIDLFYVGNEVTPEQEETMNKLLSSYGISGTERFPLTKQTKINIHQENSVALDDRLEDFNKEVRSKILEDIYKKNEEIIEDKDKKIAFLEKELSEMKANELIPYRQLQKEMGFHFDEIDKFSFGRTIEYLSENDSAWQDTFSTYMIAFNRNYSTRQEQRKMAEIQEWLQIRFNNSKIRAIAYE